MSADTPQHGQGGRMKPAHFEVSSQQKRVHVVPLRTIPGASAHVNLSIWTRGRVNGAVSLEPHEARSIGYALLSAADAARFGENAAEVE